MSIASDTAAPCLSLALSLELTSRIVGHACGPPVEPDLYVTAVVVFDVRSRITRNVRVNQRPTIHVDTDGFIYIEEPAGVRMCDERINIPGPLARGGTLPCAAAATHSSTCEVSSSLPESKDDKRARHSLSAVVSGAPCQAAERGTRLELRAAALLLPRLSLCRSPYPLKTPPSPWHSQPTSRSTSPSSSPCGTFAR